MASCTPSLLVSWLSAGMMLFIACTTPPSSVPTKIPATSPSLPWVQKITLDGRLTDWRGQGLNAVISADEVGHVDTADLSAEIWLGWQPEGVYLALRVKDDHWVAHDAPLWAQDALEVFVAPTPNSRHLRQYVIAPGMTPAFSTPRVDRLDHFTGEHLRNVKTVSVDGRRYKEGYVLEAMLPFADMGLHPRQGADIAISLAFRDKDAQEEIRVYPLHPHPSTYLNHGAMFRLRLTGPGETWLPVSRLTLVDEQRYEGKVYLAGAPPPLQVFAGDHVVAKAAFKEARGIHVARFEVDRAAIPVKVDSLRLEIGGIRQYAVHRADLPWRYEALPPPHRFEEEVRLLERMDSAELIPGGLLFVGSSSIRLWLTLPEDFPERQVRNRGFGGATTEDVLHFYDRLVLPYQPDTIVYFAGVNDLDQGADPSEVADHVQAFLTKTHQQLPQTHIVLLSLTVNLKNQSRADLFHQTNELLQQLATQDDATTYVDVITPTLDSVGHPLPELFRIDSIHLNPEGYRRWVESVSLFL